MKHDKTAAIPDDLIPVAGIKPGEYVYTPGTIRKKIARREIPCYRIANRVFVSKRDLAELGRPVRLPARGEADLSHVRGQGIGLGPEELAALTLETAEAAGCLFSEAVVALTTPR
jgi:hypothetical protein